MKDILTVLIMFLICFPAQASIGLISDIHAGKEKFRINSSGTKVYPKKAEGVFKKSLKIMKQQGVEFVLVMGDSTNKDSSKYAKKIKKVADKSGLIVIFARGNHDKKGFRAISKEDYYLREINGKKIMVLDTNYTDLASIGEISEAQRNWVYKNIEGVDIIAMHHPITINASSMLRYQWLYDLIESNGVQRVFSGHTHTNFQNGVYRGVGALTTSGYVIE